MNVRAVVAFAAVATLVALQLVAAPASAQIVTEFSAGIPPAPGIRGINVGPDGALWFSEETGNRIGRITTAGVVTEFSAGISPGANPGAIVTGPDGNLWFCERVGNRIARITPAGVVTEFGVGITPGSLPSSIAVGPDNNLWFTEFNGNRIGRIIVLPANGVVGTVTEFSAGISPGSGPASIITGSDGNLWFTEFNGNRIGRITTAGVVTEFSAGITPGSNPNGIELGPDGNAWFTSITGNRVGKITPAGVVTEYSAGISAGAGPNGITPGPDGNMWITEINGNRIAKITLAGVVTEFSAGIVPGASPRNIVTGPDGNLWFSEQTASQVGRITTAGVVTEFNAGITKGAQPAGIARGPDGNLWFTEYSIRVNAIGMITPAGVVTQFSAGMSPNSGPLWIAAGPDGNLWFTESLGDRIGRITPAGVITEFSAGITPGAGPSAISAGPDGNMWFTEYTGHRIGRIVALPANGIVGTITEFSAGITPSSGPSSIVAGPDSNLWFTQFDIPGIARITTAGVVTEFTAGISPASQPNDITAGPDGNLWFTEYAGDRIGQVIALPANGTVGTVTEFSAGISAGAHPNGIAAGPDGNLWFTEDTGNRIGRITPAGVVTTYGNGISVGAGLFGITAGPDGNMWFAEVTGARIGRLLMPASDYVVTNNNDSGPGSLREAINRANNDPGTNTVTFDPAVTGTILLTSGQISINQAMTIAGPGAATLTIDGNAANRIFSIFQTDPACPALDGPDFLVSISGLRFTNGRRLQSNAGGAIFTEHSLSLDSVILENNTAANGGGVTMSLQYPGQTLTINNTQFLNNKGQPIGPSAAGIFGAGLAVYERCPNTHTTPVPITISNSVFSGNQAMPVTLNGFGGGMAFDTVADITITDSRIIGNTVVLPNPPVATQIYRGAGIYAHAKSLTITRSEISGNSLIDPTGADLSRGGGLHLFNNVPELQGAGGLFTTKIVNSTVSGNSSSSTAGGIFVVSNVALELDNSTVAENSAAVNRTGGILFTTGATSPPSASNADAPTFKLVSSIVANSQTAVTDIATNVATMPTFIVDATNSLIETICPSPTCEITISGNGNLTAVDPMLGPLANNGGPTRTQALLAGSPAINAGSNPLALTTDQRGTGFARVVGAAADMGAFETIPGVTPLFQSAASRRVHGLSGPFDLALALVTPPAINHNPTTEPRQGPAQTIVFSFDKPLNAATVSITEGTAIASAPTFSGNDVVVDLNGVTDIQYVTIGLTNVASTDGGTGGSGSVRVGFLAGDVNRSRSVSVSDLVLVNREQLKPLTATNYLMDVNVSGSVTVSDKVITNRNLLHALPTP